MVVPSLVVSIFPDCLDLNASSTFFGSPPTTLHDLEKYFAANAVPAINPPPPTGAMI